MLARIKKRFYTETVIWVGAGACPAIAVFLVAIYVAK